MTGTKLPQSMPSLIWEAPRKMVMHETNLPDLQPEEVLIQVGYVGICGSELSGYLGHNALRVPPLVMGHEFSGEIAGMGERAATLNPDLTLGQYVTANPMIFCGKCEACQQGQTHLCINRRLIGAHRPGAFAGYTTVPAWMVVPLPTGMALRTGALAEPVACAIRIRNWAGSVTGETILVVGAGTIGLLSLQVLLLNGAARVFVTDTDPHRLSAAAAMGGQAINPREVDVSKTVRDATGGRGAVVAVDAVGKAITRDQCVKAVRSGGTVILSGLHEEVSTLPVADLIRREITLQGSFCYSQADFKEAAQLLSQDQIHLDPWIVEAPLAQGGEWFEKLSSENPGKIAKVLLVPGKAV
jgi:threonine dehydrogenase-like Zn-dependent dehydrogenase